MDLQEIRYQKFSRTSSTQASGKAPAPEKSTPAKGQFTVTARNAYDQMALSKEAQAALEEPPAAAGNAGTATKVGRSPEYAPGTTFASQMEIVSKLEKEAYGVLKSYYDKQNAENQRFPSPLEHIMEKYVNYKSPYFRSDLTEAERRTSMNQEMKYLWGGSPDFLADDVALLPLGSGNVFGDIRVKAAELCREQISGSIDALLQENGIEIPEGTEFQLTVDPYDFYIRVQGVPDEALAKAMEQAINVGDNGKLLYDHIESCNPAEFGVPEALGFPAGFDRPDYTQYKGADPWKMSIYHTVLQLTGLDIRTLDRADGTFYTPDGQDLWPLLQKLDTEDRYGLLDAYLTYRQLAESGWDSTSDANRTLAYHNGAWTDPSTLHGQHSEDVWHQDLLGQSKAKFEDYLAEREATLKKEAADRAAGRASPIHWGAPLPGESVQFHSWRA